MAGGIIRRAGTLDDEPVPAVLPQGECLLDKKGRIVRWIEPTKPYTDADGFCMICEGGGCDACR